MFGTMWIRQEVSTYPHQLYYQGMVNNLPVLCSNMSLCLVLLPLEDLLEPFHSSS